ncbi:hypothetical protein LTS08_006154 [Lithohypha guttulata]|nr:hypothetical protein LTS08_006154 [Lithohypha guttulata]
MGKFKQSKKRDKPDASKAAGRGVKRRQHSQAARSNARVKQVKISNGRSSAAGRQNPKIPFSKHDRVLLVGEGDFSFTLSLVKNYKVSAVLATSYDDEDTLKQKYPNINSTLNQIAKVGKGLSVEDLRTSDVGGDEEWAGFSSDEVANATEDVSVASTKSAEVNILHGIDATLLSKAHRKVLSQYAPFTKIVFNFPHTGGLSTDVNRQVRANQELLVDFFNSAKPLLATSSRPAKSRENEDLGVQDEDLENFEAKEQEESAALTRGQVLITLFEGEPYTLWNIRDLARHCGLQVVESFKFPWAAYPGYKHARTVGDIVTGKDRGEEGKRKGAWRGEERDARCYVLALKEESGLQDKNGKKRKPNDGSDESD